jgi:hypothetical protein
MTARWLVGAALAAACTKAEPPSPVASAAAPVALAAAPAPPSPIDARAAVPDAGLAIDAGVAAAPAPPAASYATVLRSADWARWPGLPVDLREKALLRDLGPGAAKATRTRGRLGRHDVTIVDAGGLRYWLRDGDRVVLVEVTLRLGAAAPADLLARFRPPIARAPVATGCRVDRPRGSARAHGRRATRARGRTTRRSARPRR